MKYLLVVACLVLGGCSVTGTDSKSSFACQAPEGVQCMTASGVYYNSLNNNLPALRTVTRSGSAELPEVSGTKSSEPPTKVPDALTETRYGARLGAGQRAPDVSPTGAIRAVPRVMRIWVLPWEDADGDLHDQSYLYMAVDSGHWLVEKTRKAVRPRSGGTTLLFGDATPASETVEPDTVKSGFARDLEKLAPSK